MPSYPGYSIDPAERAKLAIRVQYDLSAPSKYLFSFAGTAFQIVMTDPFFWFLVAFHWSVFFARELNYCPDGGKKVSITDNCYTFAERIDGVQGTHAGAAREINMKIPAGNLGPLTQFAVFLTIFYVNSCYTRYCNVYSAAIGIQGSLHNISYYLRAYYTNSLSRWNVLRYLLASHCIFYWSLRDRMRSWGTKGYRQGDYNPGEDALDFKELCTDTLIPKGLLLSVEVEALVKYKGDKHKMLFSWAIIALKKIMSCPRPTGEMNNPYLATEPEQTELLKNVKEQIIDMRGKMGAINNTFLFPLPFTYHHIVNLTVTVYVIILAWCFQYMTQSPGLTGNPWSLFIYPLIAIFFLSLKEMGNMMADPFGTDSVDFNQLALVNTIYNECKTICEQPEEPFLACIGDPRFNPQRNADGTISEVPPIIDVNNFHAGKMYTQDEVDKIIEERDRLQEMLTKPATEVLTTSVSRLVKAHIHTSRLVEDTGRAQAEIKGLNYVAMERVNKLEGILTSQIVRLVSELRGDPYEVRYAEGAPHATASQYTNPVSLSPTRDPSPVRGMQYTNTNTGMSSASLVYSGPQGEYVAARGREGGGYRSPVAPLSRAQNGHQLFP